MFTGTIVNDLIFKEVEKNKNRDFIPEGEFIKYGEQLLFLIEDVSKEFKDLKENQEVYTAIQMNINKSTPNLLLIHENIIFVKTDIIDEKEEIIATYDYDYLNDDEEEILYKKKFSFSEFFKLTRPQYDTIYIEYNDSILPFIKMLLETEDNTLYGVNNNKFEMILLDYFKIIGKIKVNPYGGIYLSDICIRDFYGEKDICFLQNIYIEQSIYFEDELEESAMELDLEENLVKKFILNTISKSIENLNVDTKFDIY